MKPLPRQTEPARIIVEGAKQLGLTLTDDALSKMLWHMRLIGEWNKRVNLTALADFSEMAVLHFLDSLTVFKVLPKRDLRMLDVGTGAGFPGLVLHTVDASLKLTLLDRNTKKIVFLKHAARELDLPGIDFLNKRLEDLLDCPVTFDLVISRAFASDLSVLDSFHKLLPDKGYMIRMAGPASLDEDSDLDHFIQLAVWEGLLPFSKSFRRVILYTKKSE
jgi:16S rRNA (guanine527-N7)-methyltransferase